MAGESFSSELADILTEIDLDCLDKSHTDVCWDDDFTNVAAFMRTFDEELLPLSNNLDFMLDKMHHILSVVARESRWDGFWSTFQEASINPSRLSTFLCCLITRGFSTLPKLTLQTLKVVSCYLLLISTPERNVYRILSGTTFDRSMRILQRVVSMLSSTGTGRVEKGKRKKSRNEVFAGTKKRRRKKRKNMTKNDDVDDVEVLETQENNNNNNNGGGVDDDDVEELKSELVSLLRDLLVLSSSENLDEMCVERTTEVVMEMVSMETVASMCNTDVYTKHSLINMCHLSHKILFQLVQSDQGKPTGKPHLFSKICHKLLPNVTLCKQDGQCIPQSAVLMRDNTVAFVRFVVESFGDEVEKVVKNFIQHACVSAVDKADHRVKTSQALTNLLGGVSSKLFSEITNWVTEKLSRSSKVPHRTFAVDMISMMLDGDQHMTVLAEEEQAKLHQDLVRTLIDRCSDISPSVRAKAIGSLSKFTSLLVEGSSMETTTRRRGNALASSSMTHSNGTLCRSVHRNASRLESTSMMHFCSQMSIGAFNSTTYNGTINLPDNSGVMTMLRRRCSDKKAAVRRASVVCLSNFIIFEGQAFNKENLDSVSERCNDTSTAVRKQALESLTDVLLHVPTEQVQREWLRRLLHSSMDSDNNIQMKALELLEGVVINGLTRGCDSDAGNGGHDNDDGNGGHDSDDGVAWDLVEILTEQDNYDQRRFFSAACKTWSKKNLLGRSVIHRVSERIGGRRSKAAWFLLSEFPTSSEYLLLTRRIETSLFEEAVRDFERRVSMATGQQVVGDLEGSVCGSMMKIVTNNNNKGGGAGKEEGLVLFVVDYIFDSLRDFRHRVNDISFLVDVLGRASVISDELQRRITSGFDGLFDVCKEHIRVELRVERTDDGDDDADGGDGDKLIRCLFTYGEVAQMDERRIDQSSFHLLVQFISDDNQLPPPTLTSSQSTSAPISQFRGKRCSRDVRAFVFMSLGKFCLSSCEFAKLCLPALTKELKTSSDPRSRNNVVFILCDLVIKYAAIVDPYIGCISAHLRDKCPLVRKQTCLLLTRLLQEDFVKWKGTLFFRFLRGVVDDHRDVRGTVIFALKHVLSRRSKCLLFFENFVKSIFYFNEHKNKASLTCSQEDCDKGQGDDAFCLVGDRNQEKRMEIYKFLLESMTDSQRFQIMGKLVNEVMTSFVEEEVELNEESSRVLKDVLLCLSCQEIKLSVLRQQHQQQQDDENDDTTDLSTAAVENAAKKQFITQVMRRTVIEATLPVVVSLKTLLEKHRSPVLRELMSYFAVLMKDYKQEVKEILEMDPSLKREIEFDLRRSEVKEDTTQTPQEVPSTDGCPSKACKPPPHFPKASNRRTSLATMTMIEAARNARSQRLLLNKSVV